MESFYAKLKSELVEQRDHLTRDEARADVFPFPISLKGSEIVLNPRTHEGNCAPLLVPLKFLRIK
jgi:hypothetical protein